MRADWAGSGTGGGAGAGAGVGAAADITSAATSLVFFDRDELILLKNPLDDLGDLGVVGDLLGW